MFSIIHTKTGRVWYLHTKVVDLRSGRRQAIFYFSQDSKGCLEALPQGYEIKWMERSGLPVLKKIRK